MDSFVKATCRPGTSECCRYLIMGGNGFECAKLTDLKYILDARVLAGNIRAVGDNCEGRKKLDNEIFII